MVTHQALRYDVERLPISLRESDRATLRVFWQFYQERATAVSRIVRQRIAESPSWHDVLAAELDQEVEAQRRRTLALQRGAIIDGQWEPYLDDLHRMGTRYASAGVTYPAWFDLFAAFRDVIREQLREALEASLMTLDVVAQASDGVILYSDIVLKHVGQAYLDASRDRYRALFENSPVPMWTFDRETLAFLSVNEAAIRHYGFTREEFAAMTILDIRPPEDVGYARGAIAGPVEAADAEIWRHHKKDGSIIMVEVRARDVIAAGRTARLVHINDVTDRVRAERALRETEHQLRHAQKMEAIGALASGVAHDFNNILMVIGGGAELMEESLEPGHALREEVAEIRRAADGGTALTRQLLAMSRKSAAAPRTLDIARLIADFVPMLRRIVGTDITVEHRSGELPPVFADPNHIEQVLMNLVTNARDAMPNGGRLVLEGEVVSFDAARASRHGLQPGRHVTLAVTDTGVGMDGELQQRIFEPFFTTKEPGKGTGLGLAIVHGIVGQAGGAVAVDSTPGRGTTVRVHLPAHEQAALPTAAATAVATATTRLMMEVAVLVVDDQTEVRSTIARVLESAGCHVVQAGNAEEARRACVEAAAAIAVALIDVGLPDLRGDHLAAELRALHPGLATILISGYPTTVVTDDVLAKPISAAELRAIVARAAQDR